MSRSRPVTRGADWRLTPAPDPGTEAEPVKPGVTFRSSARDLAIPFSAAEGPVRFAFGHQRAAGKVQYVFTKKILTPYNTYSSEVWLVIEHCIGTIDAFLQTWVNGRPITEFPALAIEAWNYPGTLAQGIDPNLAAVDPSWNEDMIARDGATLLFPMAYSVVKLGDIARYWPDGPPTLEFEFRGMKCLDPQTGTRIYTTNPWLQWYEWALHVAGRNLPAAKINTPKLLGAKAVAAEVMGDGAARHESHLLMDVEQPPEEWERMFRLLADGYIPFTGGQYQPWADRPVAAVASYGDEMLVEPEPPAGRANQTDRPNHVRIRFTEVTFDGTKYLWNDQAIHEEKTAAAAAGTEQLRTAEYHVQWIHNRGRAKRLAIYLLNGFVFDFELRPTWWPGAAARQIGEVVNQSVSAHRLGAQAYRIIDIERIPDGKSRPLLLEYNAARYSDTTVAEGSSIASTLPDPLTPPAAPDPATNLTLSEEIVYTSAGLVAGIKLTLDWDMPATTYPRPLTSRVTATKDGAGLWTVGEGFTGGPIDAVTNAVVGSLYEFTVVVVSELGVESAPATIALTVTGAAAPPDPVNVHFFGGSGLVWQAPVGYSDVREYRVYDMRSGTRKLYAVVAPTKLPTDAQPLSIEPILTVNPVDGSTFKDVLVELINVNGSVSSGVRINASTPATGLPPVFTPQSDTNSAAVVNGANNALVLSPTQNLERLVGATAAFQVGGISASQVGGLFKTLINATGQAGVLEHEKAAAAAADRIKTPNGANIDFPDDTAVMLLYNSAISRWEVISLSSYAASPAPVTSVFGRVGAVTGQLGDYSSFFLQKAGDTATGPMIFNSTTKFSGDLSIGGTHVADTKLDLRAEGTVLDGALKFVGVFRDPTAARGVFLAHDLPNSAGAVGSAGSNSNLDFYSRSSVWNRVMRLTSAATVYVGDGTHDTLIKHDVTLSTGNAYTRTNTVSTTHGAAMIARAGNGTTSSRLAYAFFDAFETSRQQYAAGMYGAKSYVVRDLSFGPSNRLEIEPSNGRVFLRPHVAFGEYPLNGEGPANPDHSSFFFGFVSNQSEYPDQAYGYTFGAYDANGATGPTPQYAFQVFKPVATNSYLKFRRGLGAAPGTWSAWETIITSDQPDTRLASGAASQVALGSAPVAGAKLTIKGHTTPSESIAHDLGLDAMRWRSLYAAELRVETLVAQDVIATIGGRILVGPTTKLKVDLTAVATSIVVEHNELAVGDRVYLSSAPAGIAQVEFMGITAGPVLVSEGYYYDVTRNLDGSGPNTWKAGSAVFNTGTTGDGFIDIYSVRGVKAGTEIGPTIVGNVRNSATYNDWSPRWAVGNLNGIYGYATNIYGAAFGVPTGAWVKIDPTNGVRIGHNATTKIQLDAAGNASFSGAITSASGTIGGFSIGGSFIQAGSGSAVVGMSTIFGIYCGSDVPGSAPFSVTLGGSLTATSATIVGSITATSGAIGGFTIGTTELYAGSGATRVQLSSSSGIWLGADAFASAPFRVSPAGALTATSGAIGGFSLGATELFAGSGITRVGMSTSAGFYCGSSTPGLAPFQVTPDGSLRASAADIVGSFSAGNVTITSSGGIDINGGLGTAAQSVNFDGGALYYLSSVGLMLLERTAGASIGIAASFVEVLDGYCACTDGFRAGTAGYQVSGVKVVGAQGAAVASPAADVNSLKTAVDAIRSRLQAHGLIA